MKPPKHILLPPDETHKPGDEMYVGERWVSVPKIHHGDPVGEGAPCRRRFIPSPAMFELLKQRIGATDDGNGPLQCFQDGEFTRRPEHPTNRRTRQWSR